MSKTIAVGADDFKEIIDNNYFYIDKALFIKHIIDACLSIILILILIAINY